jgi:predicted nucleic acid-binding protein
MNKYICLDSSVIIKILLNEELSKKAETLFYNILENDQTIVLPDFAWAEIGSVLRKKVRFDSLEAENADKIWDSFLNIGAIEYVSNDTISETAWEISKTEDLPTIYDAAFVAVAKLFSNKESICELWTADEKLLNSITDNKQYTKNLKDIILEQPET